MISVGRTTTSNVTVLNDVFIVYVGDVKWHLATIEHFLFLSCGSIVLAWTLSDVQVHITSLRLILICSLHLGR